MLRLEDRLYRALRMWRRAEDYGTIFESSEYLQKFATFFGELFKR